RGRWERSRKRRVTEEELKKALRSWLERARAIDSDLRDPEKASDKLAMQKSMEGALRALAQPGSPVEGMFTGAIAEPRAADLTYPVALCLHERAVRLEMRSRLAKRAGVNLPDEKKRANEAWLAATDWWKECSGQFPKDPSAPMARRLHGEALLYLGKKA